MSKTTATLNAAMRLRRSAQILTGLAKRFEEADRKDGKQYRDGAIEMLQYEADRNNKAADGLEREFMA